MTPSEYESPKGKPSAQDQGTAVDTDALAQQLADIARSLEAEPEPGAMLEQLVRAAVALIPGTDEGSLSVVQGRAEVSSRHATGDLPRQVDDLQTSTGQGPCLDAAFEEQTVRVPDMANEGRWPDFAPKAAQLGAASMLSFQLYVEGDNLGALNLYSRSVDAFTDESEHVGLLFASHAAIAFADAQKVQNLKVALASRDVIGQAKGILMERFKVTGDQAFMMLVTASHNSNRKVHDIAEELAMTGHIGRPR
ncbi:GAF and ANTAR domain-containing protein [Phycicoccus sp. M110.8]|uniref:GAF and ANTAR domain-containing protein n=1 Tax=Phycicoccus sp. M110.8 TaxID=3075433 RepID=UPI0028FD01D6|nr:GAF and ANTAR domain-containing protein [Phycicoccus sp. M110.8]MDU0314094.1 GAF and ANTAR domain-containing protein [Phycicoccus sp. M110.8]